MIWSIVPVEVIFGSGPTPQSLQTRDYLGRRIAVRQGRVDALLSTDPADFLDPRFQPGSLVEKGKCVMNNEY